MHRFDHEVKVMTKKLTFLVMMLAIRAVVWGQTSADLSAKYRQVTSYELRPDVMMTPKFAGDGQVCEIAIERRQKTDSGIVFGTSFSEKEVRQFVDELAPEGERGRDLTKHLNTTVAGGFIMTEYTYENVSVQVYGTTRPAPAGDRVISIVWPKRACGGAQQSAASEAGDPKSSNLHLTIPVAASSKPRQ